MDRRRAAGALLALAACIASSAAAPTASNHTALDLFDEQTEGCYYNFQHYGEGDRIMTNEPCLNCTCHNRMLMCYLRVCPFTKAIGQDCTVEKRADQCCPIVTCPDVPVDLLTSTSTSSPAEYGGTGIGKVDNYGCSINGKYFPEGSKVPPTPNKPCEHCYCIRNMTTCVMQECTLHVDGCTPIYHKDVCCPVRYYCDHPEDEMPQLDDMTTTVRPTPGFLLTTIAPTDAPTTMPARRDCIEDDQVFPDGALIKREKPCEHCYCMKGDIVCVVQECGTPMENEGKNCTALPPREGQCCPDTYICEGDEQSTEPATEASIDELTTLVPPRRVSVEGSGYRNEDDVPFTEVPTFATDIEGSGEEDLGQIPIISDQLKPVEEPTDHDRFAPTEEEFLPKSTQPSIVEPLGPIESTTEPDKGLNTVPSDISDNEKTTPSSLQDLITPGDESKVTESSSYGGQETEPSVLVEEESSKPTTVEETTPLYETKATLPTFVEELTTLQTPAVELTEEESFEPSVKETTLKAEEEVTKPSVTSVLETEVPVDTDQEVVTEPSLVEEPSISEGMQTSEAAFVSEEEIERRTTEASIASTTLTDGTLTTSSSFVTQKESEETEPGILESRRTSPLVELQTTERTIPVEQYTTPEAIAEKEISQPSVVEETTPKESQGVTVPASTGELSTVPVSPDEEESSEPSLLEVTTEDQIKVTEGPSSEEQVTVSSIAPEDESKEPSVVKETTPSSDAEAYTVEETPYKTSPGIIKEDEEAETTEPALKEDVETTTLIEITTHKEIKESTTLTGDVTKEIVVTPGYEASPEDAPTTPQKVDLAPEATTALPEQQGVDDTLGLRETTTESIMELSTFAHELEKESSASTIPEIEPVPTATEAEKLGQSETTTINPEDNEIAEVPSPGRIPGEGDCLLEGITYNNESIVPSTNKCHTGCKCVSSIIKCDPIICSPPPEYMDNCQLRYDTPESCCPTYVCDHGKETVPPQPHSQMSGTESPEPSPAIECEGDQCEITSEKQQPTMPDRVGTEDCGNEGCADSTQKPDQSYSETETCIGDNCKIPIPQNEELPQVPTEKAPQPCSDPEGCKDVNIPALCAGDSCSSESKPPKDEPQLCENQENCKEVEIPETSLLPCQGESCSATGQICDGDNCAVKPDVTPSKDISQLCENEQECKQTKVPDTAVPPCEGESCKDIKKECSTAECNTVTIPPQTSQPEELCTESNGCRKTEIAPTECKEGNCTEKDLENSVQTECAGAECMQVKPVLPVQDTTASGIVGAESPSDEQSTSSELPVTMKEAPTALPESPTTSTEEPITFTEKPEKPITEPESPVSDDQERTTSIPIDEISANVPDSSTEIPAKPLPEKEQDTSEAPQEEEFVSSVTSTPQEYSATTEKDSEITNPEFTVTEIIPEKDVVSKPVEKETGQPQEVTEIHETDTEKSTGPSEQETSTALSQEEDAHVTKLDEATKRPEVVEVEEKPTTVISDLPNKPEEEEILEPGKETENESTEASTPEIDSEFTKPSSLEKETKPEPTDSPTPEKETEVISSEEPSSVPETDYESTATVPIMLGNVTEKAPESSVIPDSTTESVLEVTEPSVYETDTEKSKEPEKLTTLPTKLEEPITSAVEKDTKDETTSTEEAQTELPVLHITESQQAPSDAPINVDSTDIPSFGPEDNVETSTRLSDLSEKETLQTKAPEIIELEEKETTPQTPEGTVPSKYDAEIPEPTTSSTKEPELYVTESQTISPEVPEISTQSQESDTSLPETYTIETEVVDTTPESFTDHNDKQTESPMSLVTELQQAEATTSQSISDQEEVKTAIPEVSTTQPEVYVTEEEKPKPEKSESFETEKIVPGLPQTTTSEPEIINTELPYSTIPEQEAVTEKEIEMKPDIESTAVIEQEPITEVIASSAVTDDESSHEQEAGTKAPIFIETESPVTEQMVIEDQDVSQTETPIFEEPEKTTTRPVSPIIIAEENEKETDSALLGVTEEYELSTGEPKPTEEDVRTEVIGSTPKEQESETKTTESSISEITEIPTSLLEEDQVTKKPEDMALDVGGKSTETPGTKQEEQFQTELAVPVTEFEDVQKSEDKITTVVPDTSVSEQVLTTEIPEKRVTEKIVTKSPELFTTSSDTITEYQETKAPVLIDTEPPKFDTESPITSKPEVVMAEKEVEQDAKVQSTTAIISESPTEEAQTESSISDKTSATEQPEPLITERTELETSSEKQQEKDEEQTEISVPLVTDLQETFTTKPEQSEAQEDVHKEPFTTESVGEESSKTPELATEASSESSESTGDTEKTPQAPIQTSRPDIQYSETTPYVVELEEHTHKIEEEISTPVPSEEPTTTHAEAPEIAETSTEMVQDIEKQTEYPEIGTEEPSYDKEKGPAQEPQTTLAEIEDIPEKSTEPSTLAEKPVPEVTDSSEHSDGYKPVDRFSPESEEEKEKDNVSSTPKQTVEEEATTPIPSVEIEKSPEETTALPEKEITPKPQEIPVETTAPEEEFIPVTPKVTTTKVEDEATTTPSVIFDTTTKASEISSTTAAPEVSKPDELLPTDEIPSPEDESHFPPSGGYNQEPDYVEEDQAFGPGTCRYGGKVYVSAQQIPRDDPCDFCFCFRSDIICLQQSCPPPIHGCHEEPIQGFCCPRYECPVSMATTLNVTTTTTTTTTTLPPHFLPHAYKGAAQRRGCQIKGHTYKVGEVVRASSGPCLHCTCGGDGQMKCDPKQCTPEPMLRQMIAAAVSSKRRR